MKKEKLTKKTSCQDKNRDIRKIYDLWFMANNVWLYSFIICKRIIDR